MGGGYLVVLEKLSDVPVDMGGALVDAHVPAIQRPAVVVDKRETRDLDLWHDSTIDAILQAHLVEAVNQVVEAVGQLVRHVRSPVGCRHRQAHYSRLVEGVKG